MARVLGLRLLTLDATISLMPAEVRLAAPPLTRRPQRERRALRAPLPPAREAGRRPGPEGHRLADAMRNLDEGARLLAEAQRSAP